MKRNALIATITALALIVLLWFLAYGRSTDVDRGTAPPTPQVRAPIPTDANIVFRWAFDGDLSEAKHPGLTGTGTNISFAPSRNGGQACVFNGTNSMVVVPHHDDFSALPAFSVSAWIRLNAKKTQYVLKKGASLRELESPVGLSFSQTGDAIFSVHREGTGYGDQVRHTGYALGRWVHLAGVFDRTVVRLFVDGKQVGEEPCTGSPHTNTEAFIIGSRLGLPADTLDGMIDDLTVYNRALTNQEIASEFGRN